MKRITAMLAVRFDLYQEARNYINEIITISLAFNYIYIACICACIKLMASPLTLKTQWIGRFGKVERPFLLPSVAVPIFPSSMAMQ